MDDHVEDLEENQKEKEVVEDEQVLQEYFQVEDFLSPSDDADQDQEEELGATIEAMQVDVDEHKAKGVGKDLNEASRIGKEIMQALIKEWFSQVTMNLLLSVAMKHVIHVQWCLLGAYLYKAYLKKEVVVKDHEGDYVRIWMNPLLRLMEICKRCRVAGT